MKYARPDSKDALIRFQSEYGNFIGGRWLAPMDGQYFEVICPITGHPYTRVPRSNAKDIEAALDAAHAAAPAWGRTAVKDRANALLRVADRLEQHLEQLAVVETWGNGKPIRETLAADLPLAIDHFRYFAGVIRAEESGLAELDAQTVSYHFREPLGVVGQIIPWNFPLLMAAWKLAPALAAGNCVVLKPAEQTPVSVLVLAELIQDLLPPGVLNIVNGFGPEAGQPLATSPRIAKLAFTGETSTGQLLMRHVAANIIPITLELGGKSPNVFLGDICDAEDEFLEKCIEGFTMFALNQGEVCTAPSRALIQESIYDRFMEMAMARVAKIKIGDPLDTETMMGAQASGEQLNKIVNYVALGQKEGAKLVAGGKPFKLSDYENGYFMEPTVFAGHNKMRLFQEEIFGPVLAVTKFKTKDEAIDIANDTTYGLGAGLWTRSVHDAHDVARRIKAGRVWVNCYHLYPAHAAFGGYKKSGIGRETHKMALSHYTQTKNVLVSYDQRPMGFF